MTDGKPRLIRVSSRALGHRAHVRVYVYDQPEEMRAAASRFSTSGDSFDDAAAVTHLLWSEATGRVLPIVRLCRGHLGSEVISHEMMHAAAALYGSTLPPHARARAHFTHYNEPLAYLLGHLVRRLVDALWDHGYYGASGAEPRA